MKRRKFLDKEMSVISWEVPKPKFKTFFFDCYINLDITDGHRFVSWCLDTGTGKERRETLKFLNKLCDEISDLSNDFVRMIPAYQRAEKEAKEKRKREAAKNKKKKKKK